MGKDTFTGAKLVGVLKHPGLEARFAKAREDGWSANAWHFPNGLEVLGIFSDPAVVHLATSLDAQVVSVPWPDGLTTRQVVDSVLEEQAT